MSVVELGVLLLLSAGGDELRPLEARWAVALRGPGAPPPDPTNRVADDERAAALGQRLFFDTELSPKGAVACATCHEPRHGLADGRSLSEGVSGTTSRHAPGLWNVAFHRWFFWDGRADTLWAQALAPLENDTELGSDRMHVVRRLAADAALRASFEELFGALPDDEELARWPAHARPVPEDPGDPRHQAWTRLSLEEQERVTGAFVGVGKSIAAFERRLVSGPSRFDRFADAVAAGDLSGGGHLGPAELRGFQLFVGNADCVSCHHGPMFSDGEFHDIRLAARSGQAPDPGRYEGLRQLGTAEFSAASVHSDAPAGARAQATSRVAVSPADYGSFKTPSLRNVARTGPYMHDGRMQTLREILLHYSTFADARRPSRQTRDRHLQALHLSDDEMDDLIAFLESLNSVVDGGAGAPDLRRR